MPSDLDRWKSKIKKTDSCWFWIGSTYRAGYGHFRRKINNKWQMEKAHRFSYEIYYGVTRNSMKGLFVCHTCDNPSCVNPDHLFLGTNKDNVNDMVRKKRHSFGRDKNHSWLSFDLAERIRETKRQNPSLTCEELGIKFETSKQQVSRILTNQIWKKER